VDLRKLNDWLQLLASLGVIAGLALVAIELRQNQELTRAQLNSDGMTSTEELMRSRQQEPLARAIAKSRDSPLELTRTERVMLHGHYMENFELIIRERILIRRGIYEDNLGTPIRIFTRSVLTTEYGQAWWRTFSPTLPEDLRERINSDSAAWLQARGITLDEERINELRNQFESWD